MSEITTVGPDLAKDVFQASGVEASGQVVLRKRLRRDQVLAFFSRNRAASSRCRTVAARISWAARSSSWAVRCGSFRPPAGSPSSGGRKNDAADAEAIGEAALRATMRLVAVKSEDNQGVAMVVRGRELLIRQRMQAINVLRGHPPAEIGRQYLHKPWPDEMIESFTAAALVGSVPRTILERAIGTSQRIGGRG